MPRFTPYVTVFLLLLKDDAVLLMRRQNTGWGDGNYDLVAGHIEGNEHLTTAVVREAKEEIGIDINPADARFAHLAHCLGDKEYMHVTFAVTDWRGDPAIQETDKCNDLQWFRLDRLPPNITPGTRAVLEAYNAGTAYSEIHT